MTNLSEASEILLSAAAAEPVAEFLKNLCHPHRLMIVCALVEGELGVGELERGLSIRQPSLSQHLGSLREAGIISGRKTGKTVFYRLSDDRAAKLVETLHAVFCEPKRHGRAGPRVAPGERRATLASSDRASSDVIRARPSESAVFARVGERGQP
ncbi:MAG: metalloregulator ArsR/SmtB family transcription factor [Roseiarcus sp.]